jgi:hypothetical protein
VNPKILTLLINGGRLLLSLGVVTAIYTTYIQQAKLPIIATILIIVGFLAVSVGWRIKWVKTGTLK